MRPIAALTVILLQGCVIAHQTDLTPSAPRAAQQHVEQVHVRGCTFYVLGAFPIAGQSVKGEHSGDHRVATLREAAGGRPLTGETVESWTRAWPVGLHRCTTLTGVVAPQES